MAHHLCSLNSFFPETKCDGEFVIIKDLPADEKNIILSDIGMVAGPCTNHFQICESHRTNSRQAYKRRIVSPVCGITHMISAHPMVKRKRERTVTTDFMEKVRLSTGIIIPIGTGICPCCRKKLAVTNTQEEQEKTVEWSADSTEDLPPAVRSFSEVSEQETIPTNDPQMAMQIHFDSQSSVESSQSHISSESQSSVCNVERLEILNILLHSYNKSPVKQIQSDFEKASYRTQKRYMSKAGECLSVICETMCPGEGHALQQKFLHMLEKQVEKPVLDRTATLLARIYSNAETWSFRRQVLSILVHQYSYDVVKEMIPDLTNWRYYSAKKHSANEGCGIPVSTGKIKRSKVNIEQLDHFLDFITSSHVIKDLPFGEKTMKLSTGEIINVPNVVRCLAPSALIEQYTKFCESDQFKPLGSSTMYKILDDCSASVRKSIEGIDYFVAEAGRAFRTLESLVQKLDISTDKQMDLHTALTEARQYLKADYKVHITKESKIPDHCRAYSLSDTEKCFSVTCNHEHKDTCSSCQKLDTVLSEILRECELKLSWENKEATLFQVCHALESIKDLKAHVMRARNQEDARSIVLKEMSETKVVLTCDWAVKFLPRKFREGQTDWFAKRGINWHVTVSLLKSGNEFKTITHVHIFASQISQDAVITASCINDVVSDLKAMTPTLEEVHVFTDNAGCYKSTTTLAILRKEQGHIMKTVNFCEAQDGKGPCDRRASHIKSCIKRYINEGNDVSNAQQMKAAIDQKQKGNYKVKVVDTITHLDSEKSTIKQIPSISQLFNFKFEDENIRVWKAYGIGEGKVIQWNLLEATLPPCPLQILFDWSESSYKIIENKAEDLKDDEEPSCKKVKVTSYFDCPMNGCVRSFCSMEALDNHILFGNCDYRLEKLSLQDKARCMYNEKLNSLFPTHDLVEVECNSNTSALPSYLNKGWALKGKKKRTVFSERQISYMKSKFEVGKKTGNKIDPYLAAQQMQELKEDGKFVYKANEYLTGQQIASYFSRLSMKDKSLQAEDIEASEEEDSKTKLKLKVLDIISE